MARSPISTLLTTRPLDPEPLVPHPATLWLRLLARVSASSLDRRLASGAAPELDRRLAARAHQLAAPWHRHVLARDWEHLAQVARRPPGPARPAPLCRARIVAAESEVRALIQAVAGPRVASVRGLAMARCLLGDGTGPLYNRHCDQDLAAALRQVTDHLDPGASLSAWA
jgi:hypothetical protein